MLIAGIWVYVGGVGLHHLQSSNLKYGMDSSIDTGHLIYFILFLLFHEL